MCRVRTCLGAMSVAICMAISKRAQVTRSGHRAGLFRPRSGVGVGIGAQGSTCSPEGRASQFREVAGDVGRANW